MPLFIDRLPFHTWTDPTRAPPLSYWTIVLPVILTEPSFPDLPEIIASGATLPDAFANACEALDLHLESLQKLGKRLPKPRQKLVVQSA